MNDMSQTIIARSDQINAGDLKGISRTITVKEVRIKAGEDQPVSILIEGDQKAFRPCKGVRRLLVRVWGADATKYIGQAMTIYCDPTVTWAGKEEGGIRVSHMTGLDDQIVEYMRVSRAATKPYKILPLTVQPTEDPFRRFADQYIGKVRQAPDADALEGFAAKQADKFNRLPEDLRMECLNALDQRRADFRALAGDGTLSDDNPAATEGRADAEHGDQFAD
jgi:hypothetical protein